MVPSLSCRSEGLSLVAYEGYSATVSDEAPEIGPSIHVTALYRARDLRADFPLRVRGVNPAQAKAKIEINREHFNHALQQLHARSHLCRPLPCQAHPVVQTWALQLHEGQDAHI